MTVLNKILATLMLTVLLPSTLLAKPTPNPIWDDDMPLIEEPDDSEPGSGNWGMGDGDWLKPDGGGNFGWGGSVGQGESGGEGGSANNCPSDAGRCSLTSNGCCCFISDALGWDCS